VKHLSLIPKYLRPGAPGPPPGRIGSRQTVHCDGENQHTFSSWGRQFRERERSLVDL